MMNELSSARKKELRGDAQRMKPQVHIGRQGLTPSVIAELDAALTRLGLLKVRVEGDRDMVKALAVQVPECVACVWVGQVGKTLVFYRERGKAAVVVEE